MSLFSSSSTSLFRYWLIFALFFAAHFFVRVAPPLLAMSLMKEMHLSIVHIGSISSSYFLTYTFSQILSGALLKTYSMRLLMSITCFGCALMALLFSFSYSYYTVLFSLSGYAFFSSFSFLGSTSYAAQYLEKHQSLLTGLTKSLGMAAGFMAVNILAWAQEFYDWRLAMRYISLGLAIWALVIAVFGPIEMSKSATLQKAHSKHKTLAIYHDRRIWWNSLYAGLIYFPMMVFTEGGFGPRLLGSIHPQSSSEIAFAISMIFIAWMIGGPFCGRIVDKHGALKVMCWSAIAGLIFVSMAIFIPMTFAPLSICLFLFGLTNGGIVGAYTFSVQLHGPEYSSVTLGITNMASIFLGSIVGAFLPIALEMSSHAVFLDGVPYYHAADYQRVFGSALVLAPLLSYVCALQLKNELVKS